MKERSTSANELVFSYMTLRKTVGLLGISLPFVLALGAMILFRTGLQSSLSQYYHTCMGDFYVGTLFAIGFFLLSYRGFRFSDDIAGDLGCIFAVGAALFPTHRTRADQDMAGYLHFAFAAALLLTLVYFSLCQFTRMDPKGSPTPRKLHRNRIYRVCGCAMSLCLLLIVVLYALPDESPVLEYRPIFWLESTAVVAFGISWLTKGEAILKDQATA